MGSDATHAPVEIAQQLAPTGTLRAVINLGNPVLAQMHDSRPTGITVVLAEELARWLQLDVAFTCVDAARDAYQEMADRRADVCFLADEPARHEHLVFTQPYLTLDGVFASRQDAPFTHATDVDRAGVSISVKRGSAYDLFLSRTIEHAEILRAQSETGQFTSEHLDVVAGIRQPLTAFATEANLRVLEPPFMRIQQAVGLPRDTGAQILSTVSHWLERMQLHAPVQQEIEACQNSF